MNAMLPICLCASVIVSPKAEESVPWKRHTIDAASPAEGRAGADGVRVADVNRDGHPDLVTGWENGNAIRVCLHPGPDGVHQPWPAVTAGRVRDAEDAVITDLDGDLRFDVVSACEGMTRCIHVHWAPSRPEDYLEEEAWVTTEIPVSRGRQWMFLLPFDVDRDGDADLIAGSKGPGAVLGWLVNPGHRRARLPERWRWHPLTKVGWIMSIRAIDLDGDGHREIVYSDRKGEGSGVWAMSHLDRDPWFSPPILLGLAGREVMFIDLADLDGDGRPDIAAAVRPGEFTALLQPAEKPWLTKWRPRPLGPIGNRADFGDSKAIAIADWDGDGELEAAATCERADGALAGVFLFPLVPGAEESVQARPISGRDGVKFDRIEALDLDGDGDLDLITCEEKADLGVIWFENPGRERPISPR